MATENQTDKGIEVIVTAESETPAFKIVAPVAKSSLPPNLPDPVEFSANYPAGTKLEFGDVTVILRAPADWRWEIAKGRKSGRSES